MVNVTIMRLWRASLPRFKKRVTKRKIYSTRDDAKIEIFNFIEMSYTLLKRHNDTDVISPAKYKEAYFLESTSV